MPNARQSIDRRCIERKWRLHTNQNRVPFDCASTPRRSKHSKSKMWTAEKRRSRSVLVSLLVVLFRLFVECHLHVIYGDGDSVYKTQAQMVFVLILHVSSLSRNSRHTHTPHHNTTHSQCRRTYHISQKHSSNHDFHGAIRAGRWKENRRAT